MSSSTKRSPLDPFAFMTPAQVAALTAPFPPGAVTTGGYGKGLSSIKPIYVTERLNEVLGIGNWRFTIGQSWSYTAKETGSAGKKRKDGSVVPDESVDHVVVQGYLVLRLNDHDNEWVSYESFGGSSNTDIGDMYKGAVSDALTKAAAMYLGVAAYVYKGQSNEGAPQAAPQPPKKSQYSVKEMPCPQCAASGRESTMTLIPAGVSKKTGKPYNEFFLCQDKTCQFVTRP